MSMEIRRATAKEAYGDRDETLRLLGFKSFKAYLRSQLWEIVRVRALEIHGRKCRRCGEVATQAHHASYLRPVLIGEDVSGLVPVCGRCHKAASLTQPYTSCRKIDGLFVRHLHDTNLRLAKKLNRQKRKTAAHFCKCGRMRKKNHETCRPCSVHAKQAKQLKKWERPYGYGEKARALAPMAGPRPRDGVRWTLTPSLTQPGPNTRTPSGGNSPAALERPKGSWVA